MPDEYQPIPRDEYYRLEAEFEKIFAVYRILLSAPASQEVRHYIDHGELEMAFEYFCLELMQENIAVPPDDKAMIVSFAVSLHLDADSVFEADFWKMLQRWATEEA